MSFIFDRAVDKATVMSDLIDKIWKKMKKIIVCGRVMQTEFTHCLQQFQIMCPGLMPTITFALIILHSVTGTFGH